MQEPIDNDYREFLEREEELWMMEKEEIIKHVLRLEAEYYANNKNEGMVFMRSARRGSGVSCRTCRQTLRCGSL